MRPKEDPRRTGSSLGLVSSSCLLVEGGRDQGRVGPRSTGGEVQPVNEVLGVPCTPGVPVDEYGFVRIACNPVSQHLVVWRILVTVGHGRVHHQDLSRIRESLHHLVEILICDGAVVSYVQVHHLPESARGAKPLQDACGLGYLTAAARVDGGHSWYVFLERVDGTQHHRVSDGRHLTPGSGPATVGGPPSGRPARFPGRRGPVARVFL